MKKKKYFIGVIISAIVIFFLYYGYSNSDKVLLKNAIDYTNQLNYSAALKLLNKIEHKDNSKYIIDVYRNKTIIYYKLKDYVEVINYSNKVIDSNSDDAIKQIMISLQIDSYIFLERFEEAIDIGTKYIEAYNEDEQFIINIYDSLFSAYIGNKMYDKALEVNNLLKQKQPDNVQHYIGTVYLYTFTKQTEVMQEYLKETIKKFPNDEEFLNIYNRFME